MKHTRFSLYKAESQSFEVSNLARAPVFGLEQEGNECESNVKLYP